MDLLKIGTLKFITPNEKKFPSLALAYSALEEGETVPEVLNAANEIAVSAFLKKKIRFIDIPTIIKKTMELHRPQKIGCIEDVLMADKWARQKAAEILHHN